MLKIEQLKFEISKTNAETTIDDIFYSCAKKFEYDIGLFTCIENFSKEKVIGYSLRLNKELIAKVNNTMTQISANGKIINALNLENPNNIKMLKNPIGFARYKCEQNEDGAYILKQIVEKFSGEYIPSERFGCCHRYIECSNAQTCIAPDKFHARGCYYRENLEHGKIFYGKNANNQ